MKTLSKILSGLVITGTILSTGVMAMAVDKNEGKDKNLKNCPSIGRHVDKDKGFSGKEMMKNNIENDLKALVSAGIITQDESDKLLALLKQQSDDRKVEMDKIKNMSESDRKAYFDSMKDKKQEKREDIFTKAVSNNILTQDKADAAKAKLKEIHDAERTAKLTESLKKIVNDGTITQVQADKVLTYINSIEPNKLSKDEKKEATPNKEKKNPLSKLVEDGTLTKEQLDAICKVLPMGGEHGGHKGGGMDKVAKPSVNVNE